MASIRFLKTRKRWQIRWRAKARNNPYIFEGSKVFLEKSRAISFYADIEAQEKLVRSGQVILGRTVEQALQEYLRYSKCFTRRTRQHYEAVLKKFVSSLPKDITWIKQLRPSDIREYLSGMLDRGDKNRTCNAHLTAIKSFCRYLNETFDIQNTAAKVRMFSEDPPDSRFLTKDEYEKVLEIAPPQAKARLMFLANTGLRASEFAALNPGCVDQDLTALTIIGKGRKRRTIPLNDIARSIWPIEPASRKALWFQFHKLAKRADIPPFGPHALRHYFATQLLLNNVPIIKVSMLLGHQSVKTTQACYAHILPPDLQGITDVLCETTIEQTGERHVIRILPTGGKAKAV